jgi:hypothetical protein
MARKPFDEDDVIKVLLWCGRHCCLCEKLAGVGIEVAHLPGKESISDIDDAIPLCFDCHAEIGNYNRSHPKGKRYGVKELKARRDQVYDKYTSHLVPPVDYRLTQQGRRLPDVGFVINNLGDRYPVQVRVKIVLACGTYRQLLASDHYNGKHLWNLNARQGVGGHFPVPADLFSGNECLRARVDVALMDIYKREHQLLPIGYVHTKKPNDEWFGEPSMAQLGIE